MRFLFQGDSITDASRLDKKEPLSTGQGYVRLLEARLTYEMTDAEVLNCGVSGNKILDMLARWKKDCLNLKPNVLTILVGINDIIQEYAYRNGVEIGLFEKVYKLLLEQVKMNLPDTKVILMLPFVIGKENADPIWGKHYESIKSDLVCRQAIIKRLAKEFNVTYLDLQSVFDEAQMRAPEEHWSFDCVHPTAAGHELIARAWYNCWKHTENEGI